MLSKLMLGLTAILIVILCSCLVKQTQAQCTGNFTPSEFPSYTVEWSIQAGNPYVNFTVTADYASFGVNQYFWIALGFSRNNDSKSPFMYPADVIMSSTAHAAGLETQLIEDRHTIGHSTPLPDQNSSAVIDESVFVNGTVLTMSFSRLIMASPLDNEDVSLVDPPRYWIWAVGEYDNGMFLQHNSTGRGVSPGPIMFPPLSSCVPGSSMPAMPTACQPDTTSSVLQGSYLWPMTNLSTVASLECEYGAVLSTDNMGSGDTESMALVTRECMSDGMWGEPDYSNCGESLPLVSIPTGDTLTVTVGHNVSIPCIVRSFNNTEHQIRWFRSNDNGTFEPVVDLMSTYSNLIIFENGTIGLRFGAAVNDFIDLYSIPINSEQLRLSSWRYDDQFSDRYNVAPSTSINTTYACQGSNAFGSREAFITILVETPPDPRTSSSNASSRVYTRVTSDYYQYAPFIDDELQMAAIEALILNSIRIEEETGRNFAASCVFVATTQPAPHRRVECLLHVFPSQQSAIELAALEVLSLFMNETDISRISFTGFCDHESTSDATFGNYVWPETNGGQSISLICQNIQSSMVRYAKRTCIGFEQGWNTVIDFTDCLDQVQSGIPFEFYLRFLSNFNPSLSSEIALNNIRITIESFVNSTNAECVTVPMRQGDENERVECKINGTLTDNEAGSDIVEQMVVTVLVERFLLITNTNISSADGFCNFESTDSPEGSIQWPESINGTIVNIPCPFGPTNAQASRTCVSHLNWSSPNVSECATNATIGFQALDLGISEITVINAASFVSDLSNLVNVSVKEADQSEENAEVTLRVITEVSALVTSTQAAASNISRPLIVTDIVNILDDFEEWPVENIVNQSSKIVLGFETITASLVTQEASFTSLTVVTDDIALLAERVSTDSIEENGLTFVASQSDGELGVNSSKNATNQIQDYQPLAIFSFPSGVDIDKLIDSDQEDVGVFFVVYEEDTLFPVSKTSTELLSHPVGSTVVGFTIATVSRLGSPEITSIYLPEPVSIVLRIADPDTGSAENISDAICVFFNFKTLNWDSTGCKTIYSPNDNPGEVLCQCSHLTNFAALVDISARTDENTPELLPEQVLSLHVVTYVGVVLSLVGLLVTFLTFIIFKKIRQRDVTKFHLQLCVALACMYLVFVCGIGSTDNRGGCVTVGTMIQYFTLVAWMWMGAEALLMFQKLIIVFGTTTWKYLLLVSVVCWSVPIVPVVIPVAIDPDYYITTYHNSTRSGFCFISDVGVFFGAFLGPIFLVIIFNTVIYILVIRVLLKHRKDKKKTSSKKASLNIAEVLKLILSICGIMVLLGLSWLFAVFTAISTSRDIVFVFQLIFALLNAFQGFWIFFFFVLLNSEARSSWFKLMTASCSRINAKTNQTLSTGLATSNKYSSVPKSTSLPSTSVGTSIVNHEMDETDVSTRDQHNEMLIGVDSTEMIREKDNSSPKEIIKAKSIEELIEEEESEKQRKLLQNELFMDTNGRWKRRSTKNKKNEVQEVLMEFYNDRGSNV